VLFLCEPHGAKFLWRTALLCRTPNLRCFCGVPHKPYKCGVRGVGFFLFDHHSSRIPP
jgi:hypothetical protein